MNEWAARFLSVFPERNKADLDEFIQQVTNDQAEHMYFNKEFDPEVECRPTFEQLSQERIINEANKNINVLRALENVLTDRMAGYNSLHTTLTKTSSSHNLLENVEGTLKVALDSLFVFTEQEMLQCKQHVFLSDLRKSLTEMRMDAQKRITDYQKEIAAAEKEVTAAEKRLTKTKEALERSMDYKSKMESFELDIVLNNARPGFGTSGLSKQDPSLSTSSRGSKDSLGGLGSGSFSSNNNAAEEAITKVERELKDDIRFLLRTIGHRDNVLSASRRAFQKLHRECKKAAQLTLQRIADKEQEQADQRRAVLEKLQQSVRAVDIEGDENEFIESYSGRDGALMLSAQALSLLGDLVQPPVLDVPMDSGTHGIKSGMYTFADLGAIDARTEGARSESPLVRRTPSTDSQGNALQGRSPPQSPAVKTHGGRQSSFTSSTTPVGKSGNVVSTPQASTNRFSFRRTLGLRSDSPPVVSAPSAATLPALPELPHFIHAPVPSYNMPTSVVVAAGKVGANLNSSSSTAALQADIASFLTQIFYPPGTSAEDRNSTKIAPLSIQTPSMPVVAQELTLLLEAEKGNREDGEASPVTPKILIDDNYFRHPTTPDESLEVGRHQESLKFTKKAPPSCDTVQTDSPDTTSRKELNRHAKVNKSDLHCGALDWLKGNPEAYLIEAVEGISRAIKTQAGRDAFTAELNQFRSKKVEVSEGFEALGAALWTTLSHCQAENDIHTASVIMMLSQTFYKKIIRTKSPVQKINKNNNNSNNKQSSHPSSSSQPGSLRLEKEEDEEEEEEEEEEEDNDRGVENRLYIKELLITHLIWKDGNYWEQTLWQCAIEQVRAMKVSEDLCTTTSSLPLTSSIAPSKLQTIPYDRAWHDMSKDERKQAVRRVHEVIFSQVMAITHSMLELGCSARQSREFLYRMCVIHQLSEAMRQSLLRHVTAAAKANSRRPSRAAVDMRGNVHDDAVAGSSPTGTEASTATATITAAAAGHAVSGGASTEKRVHHAGEPHTHMHKHAHTDKINKNGEPHQPLPAPPVGSSVAKFFTPTADDIDDIVSV